MGFMFEIYASSEKLKKKKKTCHFSSGSVSGKIKQFLEPIYACKLEKHKLILDFSYLPSPLLILF